MLQKLKQRKGQDGFTIIEVLIVLAIAGLILLVVFMAVPALQRNSRNTQRKADVQALLGGTTEFLANNAGVLPAGYDATAKEITGPAGSTAAGVKIGYYTSVMPFAAGAQAALAVTTDTVRIVTSAKCGTAGATEAGSARQIAVQYLREGTSARVPTCQDS